MNKYMMLSTAGIMLAAFSTSGLATLPAAIDGGKGVLHVYGSLTESPCRLEMSSAWQEVSLGNTETAQLHRVGDRGRPVTFQLHLVDCQSETTRNRDEATGNLLWNGDEPAVSVRFSAPASPENPQLLAANGVSGMGLRLTDSYGRSVQFESKDAPQLLSTGQDTLTYILATERTSAPLHAGSWHALLNIGLEYN